MIFRIFIHKKFSLFSAVLICFICAFNNAHAAPNKEDIFTRFTKPMPKLKLLSEEEFLKASKPVKKTPYSKKSLSYSMRIPKGWTEREDRSSSNFILSEKLFLELNVFYSKPTPFGRSRIEVHALNLEGNLTAEQWYLKYILEGGYTTEGLVTHNERKVESLLVLMETDYSYYLRSLILFNGDKVIMVKYFVPIHHIKDQAAMQEQVLESFKLSNIVERTKGKLQTYRFLDIAEIKFPEGWKSFASQLRSIDNMDVTLLNLRETLDKNGRVKTSSTEGRVDATLIAASPKSTLVDEIKKYKQKLESKGMLIGDKIEISDKFTYDNNMDFAITEVYEGVDSSNNQTEYEFWFTVMVGGNYYYFITLLTPSRNERFSIWAENTQNYKIILDGFFPMAGAFLERD